MGLFDFWRKHKKELEESEIHKSGARKLIEGIHAVNSSSNDLKEEGNKSDRSISGARRSQVHSGSLVESEEDKSGRNTLVIFHGISSTQRGGNSLDKLKKIFESGIILPKGELDEVQAFQIAIFKHYLGKRGLIEDNVEIDADEYLKDKQNRDDLMKVPVVKKYIEESSFREVLRRFKSSKISSTKLIRSSCTWFFSNESDVKESYGEEVYLEIKVPKRDAVMGGGGSTGVVPGPIDTKSITKIHLSESKASFQSEISELVRKKGLKIPVVVG